VTPSRKSSLRSVFQITQHPHQRGLATAG
jgi:hypothetical protein